MRLRHPRYRRPLRQWVNWAYCIQLWRRGDIGARLIFHNGRALFMLKEQAPRWSRLLGNRLGHTVARIWNPLACLVLGHYWMPNEWELPPAERTGLAVCTYCCRERHFQKDAPELRGWGE